MNKIFLNNIGDLAETQRASFYNFLSFGISEELTYFPNPFVFRISKNKSKDKKNSKRPLTFLFIYLYPNEIKLKGLNTSSDTCLKENISYILNFFVLTKYLLNVFPKLGKIKEINKQKFEKQSLFLGQIPLMTEEGTFIINGCERVVISQIIRNPGIYFSSKINTKIGKEPEQIYTATIITHKGSWTKFFLDKNSSQESENFDKNRIYMKIDNYKESSKNKEGENDENDENDENFLFIFDILLYLGISYIDDKEDIYDIYKTCQLTNENLSIENKILIIHNLFLNKHSGRFSIGKVGRYRINQKLRINLPLTITQLTAQDFVKIIDTLIELSNSDYVKDDIDHIKNKQIRSIGNFLQTQFNIGIYQLRKKLEDKKLKDKDDEYEHDKDEDEDDYKTFHFNLTYPIKIFFITSQLSQYLDQTNPLSELTHKRRISVFGPNGLKRDHISTIVRDIHPSQYGRLCPIETPEGQNAGLLTSIAMFGRIGFHSNSIGYIETPYFNLQNSRVYSEKSPVYLNPYQEEKIEIGFADVSLTCQKMIIDEYISIKKNTFFLMKKTNEVKFITTSPLQIVSLSTSLIPFLEHDDANRALMGSNMQRQAIPLLFTQKPIVGTGIEAIAILDSGLIIKSYCEGEVKISSSNFIKIKDSSKQFITYYLTKHFPSNQKTSLNQRPLVWSGEKIYSNQVLVDGPGTNDGELSLGRNLTIAYMPWEGYNYEDAIILNERIILENCLTSIHLEEYEIKEDNEESEKITSNLPHLTNNSQRHLGKNGIVKIGSYVKEDDVLVGKIVYLEEIIPGQRLLQAILNKKIMHYKDISLKVPYGSEGKVIEVRKLSSNKIRVYIAKIRKIQIGDKLAGRHGNKGVISRILTCQDMPYLPDGTSIDILFNPLGVPSRMNVGQVLECLLGFAGEKLGTRFKIAPFDEIYGKEASRILVNQKLKEAAIKTNYNWVFNSYYPGKILLRDGRTGEYFDNPITVGKSYILKLIHMVEDKIHIRSIGPYSTITEQPLAGKSQKGGQRFGEMEVWALEAYGCSNTLQELLTIKSDDIDSRNDMYKSILTCNKVKKPTPSISESFLVLLRELNALGLNLLMKKHIFKSKKSGFEKDEIKEGSTFEENEIEQDQKYDNDNMFKEKNNYKVIEIDIFKKVEKRLQLRALLIPRNLKKKN